MTEGTAPAKWTKSPLANFAALGPSELLGRAVGFYATALLARKLGVDAFGYLGFAIAIMSYFGVALTAGFADIGAREVARDPMSARRLGSDATGIRLLIAAAGMAAIALTAFAFIESPVQRAVLLLSSLGLIASALDTTWVYRGLSRNTTSALALLLAQVVYLGGVIAFVSAPGDVLRVPLIQLAGDMLAALLLIAFLFRGGIPRPSMSGGLALLKQSGFITASRLMRALIVSFDVLLLGLMTGSHQVGLYTAAYRVCMLVTTIAVATHIVFLPAMTRSVVEGIESLTRVMTRSLSLSSAVILPIVVGGIILAEPLLVFLFGADYGAGSFAFQILLASMAVLAIHGTTHNVFIAMHETRRETFIFGGGAVVNVVLNLVLIPRYQLAGAAVATLAAEGFILAASGFALYRFGLRPHVSRLILPLVGASVMGAVLLAAAGRVPLLALIAIGAITYLAVFGAGGGIRREMRESGAESAV